MKNFWTLLYFEVFKPWLISNTKHTIQLLSWLDVSVCNTKINILESLFLCLVHPPEIFVLLVSPSDFTWEARDGDALDVQPAPSAGHQGQITVL